MATGLGQGHEPRLKLGCGKARNLFDRIFGTYEAEAAEEPCRYGLTTPVLSINPVTIAFHEWGNMLRDVRRARGFRNRLRMLFGPPGAPLEPR